MQAAVDDASAATEDRLFTEPPVVRGCYVVYPKIVVVSALQPTVSCVLSSFMLCQFGQVPESGGQFGTFLELIQRIWYPSLRLSAFGGVCDRNLVRATFAGGASQIGPHASVGYTVLGMWAIRSPGATTAPPPEVSMPTSSPDGTPLPRLSWTVRCIRMVVVLRCRPLNRAD